MTTQELEAFVLVNHQYLTLSDMGVECDKSPMTIKVVCQRLNVVAITIKEKNENYLKECHKFKTVKQLSKAMGIGEQEIKKMCKQLGLTPKLEGKEELINPLRALKEFQLPNSNHHYKDCSVEGVFSNKFINKNIK